MWGVQSYLGGTVGQSPGFGRCASQSVFVYARESRYQMLRQAGFRFRSKLQESQSTYVLNELTGSSLITDHHYIVIDCHGSIHGHLFSWAFLFGQSESLWSDSNLDGSIMGGFDWSLRQRQASCPFVSTVYQTADPRKQSTCSAGIWKTPKHYDCWLIQLSVFVLRQRVLLDMLYEIFRIQTPSWLKRFLDGKTGMKISHLQWYHGLLKYLYTRFPGHSETNAGRAWQLLGIKSPAIGSSRSSSERRLDCVYRCGFVGGESNEMQLPTDICRNWPYFSLWYSLWYG